MREICYCPTNLCTWRPNNVYFGRKEAYIQKKSCSNLSAIGVTDLPEYKKRFSARSGEHETEENREGDPISEGLPPPRGHGYHGPEGELSSHLGGGQGRIRRRGLSPPLSRWCRSAARGTNVMAIYTNNFASIITNSLSPYAAV